MKETSKTNKRRRYTYLFKKIFVGAGIDIGPGKDLFNKRNRFGLTPFPKTISCEPFDLEQGDAQYINKYRKENEYDFVHSSNCLEHMKDPEVAIKNWFSLVKNGGYLVCTVPDEDLYEQGVFPSRYNEDHKWTFTIHKKKSWCDKSINIIDLLKKLDNCKIIKIELVDTNYDHSKKDADQTLGNAEAFIEIVLQKTSDNNE